MKKYILNVVMFALLALSQAANADIPGFDQPVYLEPNGQSPNAFVKSLFGQIGVPVRVDGEIDGVVDGVFEDTAAKVFKEFSRKFDAHVYFDRKIAYVYRADDVIEKTLPMSNRRANEVFRLMKERDVTDALNQIYIVPGEGLDVVGNRRFIERVELKVENLQLPAMSGSTSTTVAQSKSKAKIEASKAKLVFKQFKLKYASVVDQTVLSGGEEKLIPGVETLLWAFVNGGSHTSVEMVASVSKTDDQASLVEGTQIATQAGTEAGSDVGAKTDTTSKQATVSALRTTSNGSLPLIKADSQTNSLYVKDTPDRLAEYQLMIDIWDQRPRMVEIEVSIIDINNSKQRELGVNWRAINGGNELRFGQGTAADFRLNPGQLVTPAAGGGALSLSWGNTTKFIARMRALEELGAAKFVSKPHVTTKSNLEATVVSTIDFLVKLEGTEAVSLEEKSYGTVLTVTPRVIENGVRDAIDLGILVEDGQATGERVADLPEISRSALKTHTLMEQGESLLIGGLIRETKEEFTKKIPFVGDVPVLGKLFTSNGNRVARTERLILITPRIIGDTGSSVNGKRILKGAAKDIVKSSDQRLSEGSEEIELLATRQTLAVNGESSLKRPLDALKQTVFSPRNQPGQVITTQLSDLTVIPEIKNSARKSEPVHSQDPIVNQGQNLSDHTIAVVARQSSNTGWGVEAISDTSSKWKPAIQ